MDPKTPFEEWELEKLANKMQQYCPLLEDMSGASLQQVSLLIKLCPAAAQPVDGIMSRRTSLQDWRTFCSAVSGSREAAASRWCEIGGPILMCSHIRLASWELF